MNAKDKINKKIEEIGETKPLSYTRGVADGLYLAQTYIEVDETKGKQWTTNLKATAPKKPKRG